MWHEARKQEKKLRVLIVDYRRRAERRREFYEKFKADPTQFMQVHGRPTKIYLEPHITAAAENCMMPWQGNSETLIDRFDVRAHLDYIPEYKGSESASDLAAIKEEEEDPGLNYERYRILIQNDLAGISEDKFLHQIHIEEQFGTTALVGHGGHHPAKNSEGSSTSKSNKAPKAAIAYSYEDSTPAAATLSAALPKSSSAADVAAAAEEDSDDDLDFDLLVNVNDMTLAQKAELNANGTKYAMGPGDFMRYLNADLEEKEQMRLAKLQEEEKQAMSGRKARRERRAYKDKIIMRKGYISPPSYAARASPTYEEYRRSSSRSDSGSRSNSTEKITYITSFGGNDSDEEKKKQKGKYPFGSVFGPSLPPPMGCARKTMPRRRSNSRSRSPCEKRRVRSRSKSRSRSRSRSRIRSRYRNQGYNSRRGIRSSRRHSSTSSRSRSKSLSRNRSSRRRNRSSSSISRSSRSRSRGRGRRRSSRSRSRSKTKSHARSNSRSLSRSRNIVRSRSSRSRSRDKWRIRRRSNSLPRRRRSRTRSRSKSISKSIRLPISYTKSKSKDRSSSVSSGGSRKSSKAVEPGPSTSKLPSNGNGHDHNEVSEVLLQEQLAPVTSKLPSPPVKRYYGRRKIDGDDSEKSRSSSPMSSSDKSDTESLTELNTNNNDSNNPYNNRSDKLVVTPNDTQVMPQAYSSGGTSNSKSATGNKMTPQERLKRRMQSALNRQLKADKDAEKSRVEKQVQERLEREESLRELTIKYRRREREKRHKTLAGRHRSSSCSSQSSVSRSRSKSKSKSRSQSRSRSRSGSASPCYEF